MCGRRRRRSRACAARADAAIRRSRTTSIEQIPDDRLDVEPGDTMLLVVEDDPHYARVLLDLAHDKGFKVLVAVRGAEALDLAKQYQPTAVSLDVFLPDMLGWTVLSQLKQNPLTRHIPVQIVTLDEDRQHGLARGAFSFITKPTTTEGCRGRAGADHATTRSRAASGCWWSRTTPPSSFGITRAARPRRHRDRHRGDRGRRAGGDAPRGLRLRGARPASAGHVRLRGAGAHPRRTAPVATFRSWCSPAASCRRRRTRSFTPWPAASWSRAWSRRSGCSTKPRCSCTASSPTCRRRSSACWNGCTAPTRTWSAQTVLLVDDDARNIFALSAACWSGAA